MSNLPCAILSCLNSARFEMIALVPPSNAIVASSPKLLDRVRWHLRAKDYSIRIEQAYVHRIRRFILFHRKRHPNEMGEKEIMQALRPIRHSRSNQSMKPTAPFRNKSNVSATTPCRGLSLSR
jgi:hypothetical protein